MKTTAFPASVPLCRLYERQSKQGNSYLTGRLGSAKIVVLKSNDKGDDGAPIWNVLLSPAPQKPAAEKPANPGEPRPEGQAAQNWQRPPLDDAIPF